MLLQALHIKFLTTLGSIESYITFQTFSLLFPLEHLDLDLFKNSWCKWEALLTKKMLFIMHLHTNVSSLPNELKMRLKIASTSSSIKLSLIRLVFQSLELRSTSSDTFACSFNVLTGDWIEKVVDLETHLSHNWILFPLPTLHHNPSFKSSLVECIFLQAYEAVLDSCVTNYFAMSTKWKFWL